MDGPRDHHAEWSKSEREKLIQYINIYMWNLEKNGTDEPICKAEMKTEVENKCVDIPKEEKRRWEKLGLTYARYGYYV